MDIKQNIIWQHFNPKGQLEIIKCFLAVFMNNFGRRKPEFDESYYAPK